MRKNSRPPCRRSATCYRAREKETAAANLEAGKKFLEENGKREGVTTTKSGLQYEVITKGGEEKYVAPKEGAEDNKQFMVNYKGTLINGKQFDASPAGEPVPMTLQVVEGFKEALTTMPVGAKWKLFLPSNLAYGEERRSADIGPNSALIFELELVKIQDAPAAPEGGMPFPMPQGATRRRIIPSDFLKAAGGSPAAFLLRGRDVSSLHGGRESTLPIKRWRRRPWPPLWPPAGTRRRSGCRLRGRAGESPRSPAHRPRSR